MSLNVVCPGCLKRFQVSDRFAGRQGPCPSCGTIISIPKESVSFHGMDEAETQRRNKRKLLLRPIERLDWEVDPIQVRNYALGVLGVLVVVFVLGCIPMYTALRAFFGIL
jgi:hypothetical protein